MPYGKKYRKKPYKKNNKNLTRAVRSIIYKTMETKHNSTTYNQVTVGTQGLGAARLYHVTGVSQGSGNTQRDGHQIKLSGMYMNIILAAADSTNILRIIVFRYKGRYTAGPMTAEVYSILDLDDVEAIYDKTHVVSTNGPAAKNIKIALKFRNRNLIQYDDSTDTSVTVNPWFVYFVTDSAAVTHPTITGQIRTYWKDN